MAKTTTKSINLDFAFFTHLLDFYKANKKRIRQNYRDLTKKFLDFNDPSNSKAYLRQPQFEALEIYVFLKEFLDNAPVHEIFRAWSSNEDKFEGRAIANRSGQIQLDVFQELSKNEYDQIFSRMRANSRDYSNYIFALTMGTGKTILMATCIFYEFILANKFPKDSKYCHNALVFAPDKTVLQSLREIETFDKSKVIPPEYLNFISSNLRIHFLDEAGATLSTIDDSRFNIVISNTQKIILKRQSKDKSPLDKLMGSGKPTYQTDSVYAANEDLYGFDEPDDDDALTTNQRFEKLRRIGQLGIFIDEAHHVFGSKLANDMGVKQTATSLRKTVDELAISLKKAGTRVVACYNYTGTPYVGKEVLPEVVYAYGLQEAIDKGFLKKVKINGYTNTRTSEFIDVAIADFLKQKENQQRHEGLLPKMAFFAATVEELQNELRPAVEQALAKHNIPSSTILVNVGDEKITTNDEIREFNNLDKPNSEKRFILLVNKGREGWNCRSLFSVALFRQPRSKIFILQATMRCLRAIGDAQQTGHVYLSADNKAILDAELQQNFRISISDMEKAGQDKEIVEVRVVRVPTIELQRIRKQYQITEKQLVKGISLKLEDCDRDRYRIMHIQQDGLPLASNKNKIKAKDITEVREKRQFSPLTLIAEISRYLNKSPLTIEEILESTQEGIDAIVNAVNEFNEVLYDWVIPKLFAELYDITTTEQTEPYEVELVKIPKEGYYKVSAVEDNIVRSSSSFAQAYVDKSFHLDTYCFDSKPEQKLFWDLLKDGRVKKLYFTGMLTHGQSDFFIQYIDPDSHTVRSYYPDFLFQKNDDTYVIVEVKGDNKIDDPTVQAKKNFAEAIAGASKMTYKMIASSTVGSVNHSWLFEDDLQAV